MKKFGTYTVFDLIIKYIREGRITLDKSRIDVLATYHDPCNYGRKSKKRFGKGFFDEPRWILDQCVEKWVEMYPSREHQLCCGGGGGAMTTGYDAERIHYGRRKIDQIKATGAKMVVMPCHGCHGQITSLKKEYGMADLQVKYLWEVVADVLVLK